MTAKTNIKQILQSNKIAIIGAGASGLLSSIILGRAGFNVTVFEKNTKIGRKILASGNGKCNISNENISPNNFNDTSKEFISYSLNQFNYQKFKIFFQDLGLELKIRENHKVYPLTLQSSSVVDLLIYEAKLNGVKFILDTNIDNIEYENDKFTLNSINFTEQFNQVVVSSGTNAMSKLSSSNSSYDLARIFKHTIVEPFASLVQLKSNNTRLKELSGVKLESRVKLEVNKEFTIGASGDILFTNYGVSGNAILDISRDASYALSLGSSAIIYVDIFPNIDKNILISKLTKRLENSQSKDKYFWLEGFLHKKLIKYIVDECGIKKDKIDAKELTKKDIMSIVYFVKNIKINITDTNGLQSAEVVAGGIDILEIEPKTMQSRLQNGLYFTGEVLDVDGQCGGYNLHWAWASAYTCANAIINKNKG